MKRFTKVMPLVLALIFTACGNDNANNEGKDSTGSNKAQTEQASSGETTYNSFLAADPTTIDAQKGDDVNGNSIVNNVYEPLLRFVQDGEDLKLEEAGAESYEISEDGMTYTFKIRPDMKWEDGEPLTAKNYEYGIKRSVNPETAAGMGFLLADIENFDEVNSGEKSLDELGVKAIDDNTLEIKLSHPATYFTSIIPVRVCFPQREDIIEAQGDAFGSDAGTIIGCGPFKLTEWTHNSQLVMEKNPDYWDADKVKLEKINLRVLTDINARMNAFQAKEINSIQTNLPEWTSVFDKMEGVNTADINMVSEDYILPNHKDELFANEKVRKAFNIAIDREGLNKTALGGQSTPAYFWVPDSISLNETNFREKAGLPLKDIIDESSDPKDLLEEGLEEIGKGQKPEDLEISLIMTNDPFLKKSGEYIQENLQQKLGVKVNLELLEWPILSGRVNKGDYQLAYLAWFADYNNPSAMLSLFTSDATAIETGWTSEEYDNLIKEASKETDDAKAIEFYKEAEQMLMDESVVYPIITGKTTLYYQDKVENINTNPFSTSGYKYTSIK
ncbi:peptide ABC transporter substrate-binding protein [uncultured Anaerococcus sp.]|uniref:peptide ABC transporter substrate-binding protein n=1 Tax=uncultured Anaerococcus sp. TaxID=293428 RepID=UPI002607C806|nr:peptide ABC transporter substrate-binding protein [uncultured Anaerococcus sp.]